MFHHERDWRRFIVARGILRILLGDYTSTSPESVGLQVLPGGKPALTTDDGLHFNLSHSGELALFAFADREVGIDVERLSSNDDMARVATHFFSAHEAALFNQLTGSERTGFFFRTWVRKEAYLKAIGDGFAVEPSRLTIDTSPAGSVRIENREGTQVTDARYLVHDLDDIDNHVAAIATTAADESGSDLPVSRPIVLQEFSPHILAGIQA